MDLSIRSVYSLFLLLMLLISACNKQIPSADLIVKGKIWTGNDNTIYAEAFAVVHDTLVAIGTWEEIKLWQGEKTKVIEVPNEQLIVPGFIDTHTHFIDGGQRLSSVQLRDAKTPEEFIDRIKTYALTIAPGEWITGGDWDHENWGGALPEKEWIDSITQNNPVWINRLDGHMSLANTAALKSAGIQNNIKPVTGGAIVRNAKGNITGVFKDNAQYMIDEVVPVPSNEQLDKALDTAMRYVASKGVTSVHNVSGYSETFERAHAQKTLITRIYAGSSISRWQTLATKIKKEGRGDDWLRIGAVKEFVDGSLGSHTAAFFKAFSDAPSDSGFFVTSEHDLYSNIKSADSAGLQLMVHAIGDKAIHTLLNIFEKVTLENGAKDRRFRIEHAQHIDPADIARFKQFGVIASMQPYHAIDDGRWAEKVIGHERGKTTYAFKSLLDAGAIVSFGSDWFVAPPTPLEGIYAAVTRRTLDNKNPNGWIPEQKISVDQALKAYTLSAAYASFEEKRKGSLEAGKLADFVILEKDITQLDPAEIRNVKVLMTVVGGQVVYQQ